MGSLGKRNKESTFPFCAAVIDSVRKLSIIMAGNKKLHAANKAKKDEFYTQLPDIENELKHYKQHFKGKTVLCNCDDPRISNFFHYFSHNFEALGLKKLITTCYKSQERDLFSSNDSERAIWLEYNGDRNGNRVPDPEEIGIHYFNGDGDFRSPECIELLKQADIVVTNPPFSLFREYVAQLMKYDKKFVIIGHQNAIGYHEIFPLIRDNKLWLGYGFKGGAGHFISKYEDTATAGDHREGMIRVSGVNWFTNLEIQKRHEDLILYKAYSPDDYKRYENFNAINIDKTSDIPINYDGVMGVPITFMDKYNPEQFEIIGLGIASLGLECGVQPYKPEHKKYRKEIQKRGVVDGDLYMMVDGVVTVPYSRILIRRRQQNANELQTPMAAEDGAEYGKNK
ncbi:MAG: adenine-specific methyltransferase EcoRI family protein [Paludibacteraceae bacterium]|nr:adenine-specific methyltransferase EcoRI family protein [Paludibacteraceae bacterium]